MLFDSKYNKSRDIAAVASGLAVDVGNVLKTGKIPVQVGPSEAAYNGIDNPSRLGGRPSDIFDSMRMEKEVYKSAKSAAEAKKAAEAAAAAAAAEQTPGSPGAPATSQE